MVDFLCRFLLLLLWGFLSVIVLWFFALSVSKKFAYCCGDLGVATFRYLMKD